MPFLARDPKDKTVVDVANIAKEDRYQAYECLSCDAPMKYRKPARDESGQVKRRGHFWHHTKPSGSDSGAGGCSIGGESQEHEAMKRTVIEHLRNSPSYLGKIYSEMQVGSCIADVLVEFSSPKKDRSGVIVEVQYRNESKDYLNVTKNALRNGYSIYWVFHHEAMKTLVQAKDELAPYTDQSLYLGEYTDGEVTLGTEIYFDNFTYYVKGIEDLESPSVVYEWYACQLGEFDITRKDIMIYMFNDASDELHYVDRSGGGTLRAHYNLENLFNSDKFIRNSPVRQPERTTTNDPPINDAILEELLRPLPEEHTPTPTDDPTDTS